jgi:hypothetical protein
LSRRLIPSLVTRSSARVRTTALVVLAVLATAAGGTTLAWSTAGAAEPSPSASGTPPVVRTAEPDGQQDRAGAAAAEAQRTAEQAARKAQRKADQKARKAGGAADPGRPAAVPEVAFTCDPTKSHGQNVSAYARSLALGPGRGRQVSQVARSDCGKPARGHR